MGRRRSLTGGLAALALLVLTSTAAAGGLWLEEVVPQRRALVFFEFTETAAASEAFATTDLGSLWQQLGPFKQELMKGLEGPLNEAWGQVESETGLKLDDVLGMLGGGFELCVLNLGAPGAEPEPGIAMGFSAEAFDTVKAVVDTIRQQAGEEAPPITVEKRGDMAVLTALCGPDVLYERGAGGTLVDLRSFGGLRTQVWGDDQQGLYYLFVNVGAALRLLPPDPDVDRIRAQLGVDGVHALGMGLGFHQGRVREGLALATDGEHRGILAMLAKQDPIDVREVANKVPYDVMSFAALSLDLRKLWDDALALAEGIEPGAREEAQEMLVELEAELGFSLDELFNSIGSLWTFESSVPEEGLALLPDTVISVEVKNAAKLNQILGDLAALGDFDVKTLSRDGISVRYLLAPLGQLGQEPFEGMSEDEVGAMMTVLGLVRAWTIRDGRVFFSASPQALIERFERLGKAALTESESFKRALGRLKPGARMFGYSRPDRAMGTVYHGLAMLLRTFEPLLRSAGIPVDSALLPSPAKVAGSLGAGTSEWRIGEEGMALLIEGGLPVLTSVGGVAVAAALFVPMVSRSESYAEPAMPMNPEMSLYMLQHAQEVHRAEHGAYAGSVDALLATGVIDPEMVYGVPGYEFVITEASAETYRIEARPYDPSMSTWTATPEQVMEGGR